MSIFGDIDFLAYWELAAIMNFGYSPAQKHGGFFFGNSRHNSELF